MHSLLLNSLNQPLLLRNNFAVSIIIMKFESLKNDFEMRIFFPKEPSVQKVTLYILKPYSNGGGRGRSACTI